MVTPWKGNLSPSTPGVEAAPVGTRDSRMMLDALESSLRGTPPSRRLLVLLAHHAWSISAIDDACHVASASGPFVRAAAVIEGRLAVAAEAASSRRLDWLSDVERLRSVLAESGLPIPWAAVEEVRGDSDYIAASYERAVMLLTLAGKACALPRVASADDALLWGLLASHDLSSYFRNVLRRLRRQPNLITTLQIYAEENLSVRSTADRLGVHRNTVTYRLDRIERLTGRSLRFGPDRLILELAATTSRLEATVERHLDDPPPDGNSHRFRP